MKFNELQSVLALVAMLGGVVTTTAADGAEDPGARALERQQLQRQQQQDALQLRLQQQRALQSAPADPERRQALERQQQEQRQKQQQLHDRQVVAPETAQPSDDAGTRAAKAEMERQKAREESRRQLQRAGDEQRKQ